MNPFLNLQLQPGYGDKECVVSWRLAPSVNDGDVYVYKAEAAEGPWKLLNDGAPVRDSTTFVDRNFQVTDVSTHTHYRLLLEHKTGEFDSPVVGLFEKLSRREFGIARRAMRLELFHKKNGKNGVEVIVIKPKKSGPRCRCVDKSTGQSNQASLCPYCFGTTFEGGYHPPVLTWFEIERWQPRIRENNPNGAGTSDMRMVSANALAFPELSRDDVIIHRELDNRFAVIAADPVYFNGCYPIKQELNLIIIPRQDVRYKVPY